MSNIFETIKQNVTARQAAEYYGVEVKRNGTCCCPFHGDRHPSAVVDRRFHCFVCNVDYSVIDFTAEMFGLTPVQACKQLARDFGIPIEDDWKSAPSVSELKRKKTVSKQKQFDETVQKMFLILKDYYLNLLECRKRHEPKSPDEPISDKFWKLLRYIDFVDWALDMLNVGSADDKADFIAEYGKRVLALENKIR